MYTLCWIYIPITIIFMWVESNYQYKKFIKDYFDDAKYYIKGGKD